MSQVLKIINIGNDQTHVNSNQYHEYAEFYLFVLFITIYEGDHGL